MRSQLEAVNTMLMAIGTAPVNTITGAVSADVEMARTILEETRHGVLLEGWTFNTALKVKLTPRPDGRIQVPINTMRVDVNPEFNTATNPVQRGLYLYDRASNSYTFSSALEVDLIQDLPWDELPDVARHYIERQAARVFTVRAEAGEDKARSAERDEIRALTKLQQHELDTGDFTIFDNATSQDILRRGR